MERRKSITLLLFLLILLMVSCQRVTQPEVLDTPTVQNLPVQIETPELTKNKKAQLWFSDSSDQSLVANIEAVFIELASKKSYEPEILQINSIQSIDPLVEVVVAIEPIADMDKFIENYPDVEFIVIGIAELSEYNNLSRIQSPSELISEIAFMSGYLSVLVTEDYRVGVLTISNDEIGSLISDSFFIGARYFCGLCNSKFGPVDFYPKLMTVQNTADDQEWKSAIDSLTSKSVTTLFVDPRLLSSDLLNYLSDVQMKLITNKQLSDLYLPDTLVGSFVLDYPEAISEAWTKLLDQNSSGMIRPEIKLVDINQALLSEGKERLILETGEKLKQGLLNPHSVN